MATILIETTAEEQQKVLEAIKAIGPVSVSVRGISTKSGLSQNRTRYALEDLINSGRVTRVVDKCYNPRYIRYRYYVVKTG